MAEEKTSTADPKQDSSALTAKPDAKESTNATAQPAEKSEGRRKNVKEKFDWRHMEDWQKSRLFGTFAAIVIAFGTYLLLTCGQLYQDKSDEDVFWNKYLDENPELTQKVEEFSQDAAQVETAIYLEQVRSVDIKNSQFEVVLDVGYRWNGHDDLDFSDPATVRFYKGSIKSATLVNEYHEGGVHYNHMRYNVVINKQFWTPRFPLESHQLRMYLESAAPVNEVVFVPNQEQSYTNPSLGVTGYKLQRFDVAQAIVAYDQPLLNPQWDTYTDNDTYKTEVMTQIEINRDGVGLYIKCFIALYGTLAWILLCLYICTFRRVDPLGMIGAAFFGAVSNIMVGANLLPDALQLGLVEYTNLFGVAMIVTGTAVVISINAIRKERANEGFAQFYGRIMLLTVATIVIVGNIALPLSAYMF